MSSEAAELLMAAVFVTLAAELNLRVMDAVAVALPAIVPILKATTPADRFVVPAVVVAEISVAPGGNGLVITTPLAGEGT